VKAVSANTRQSANQQKSRSEILNLYKNWKTAWQVRDVDAIMKLYSPRIRFRSVGAGTYNNDMLRQWFIQLWGEGIYTVSDIGQPHLSIQGDYAVLLAGQMYSRNRSIRFTNRYILRREAVKGSAAVGSNTTRRWLIAEEDYLPFQGSTDIHVQIYRDDAS
jgi:hypothetical protein